MSSILADALRAVTPSSGVSIEQRRAAWETISAELQERWFIAQPVRFGAAPDLVEDVRQTVFVKLLSGRAVFSGVSDGEAVNFVKALARNATVDISRRRKLEEPLTAEHVKNMPGGIAPDEQLHGEDVSRRLERVVERATQLAKSPTREILERHLQEAIFGQPAADGSLDSDPAAAARLRKERSRALGLLRRAHMDLLGVEEADDVDLLVRSILATSKSAPVDD